MRGHTETQCRNVVKHPDREGFRPSEKDERETPPTHANTQAHRRVYTRVRVYVYIVSGRGGECTARVNSVQFELLQDRETQAR